MLCELQKKGQKSATFHQNHIVLMSEIGTQQYFFDLINWNVGKINKNKMASWHQELSYRFTSDDETIDVKNLAFINLFYEKMYRKLSKDLKNLMILYKSIQPEIQAISKIIKKYENYARLHIQYVYE